MRTAAQIAESLKASVDQLHIDKDVASFEARQTRIQKEISRRSRSFGIEVSEESNALYFPALKQIENDVEIYVPSDRGCEQMRRFDPAVFRGEK